MSFLTLLKTKIKFALTGHPGPYNPPIRHDVVRFPVQKHIDIYVFWKSLEHGRGTSSSLFVHGNEIFRFDCFGENRGHYHINLGEFRSLSDMDQNRYLFSERTKPEQIEKSANILGAKIEAYLKTHRSKKIRNVQIDFVKLKQAMQQMKTQMLEYCSTIPEIQ